jgi:hypothetical protein
MLVVGVTCTLSSRSFLLVRLVTSRPSSMFRSPSLSCFCNLSSPIILSCQSATVFVFVFVFDLVNVSTVSPFVFLLFHHRIPVVVRSPDLWLPFGFSVLSSVSVSVICSILSSSCSGATWFSLNITVYPYLSISFFAFDIRCPCSPTCFFVPRLGLFYRRSTLHPSILPPRLISDFLCPSQRLPFFSLYSLLMARLWRFGFLFCSSVSPLSRASVLRRRHCPPLFSYVVLQ